MVSVRRHWAWLCSASLWCGTAAFAHEPVAFPAPETAGDFDVATRFEQLQKRLDRLESENQQLKQSLFQTQAPALNGVTPANAEMLSAFPNAALAGDSKPVWKTGWNHGIEWATEDKQFRVHLGGQSHIDAIFVDARGNALAGAEGIDGPKDQDSVGFRRARLRAEGTMSETIDFASGMGDLTQSNALNLEASGPPTTTRPQWVSLIDAEMLDAFPHVRSVDDWVGNAAASVFPPWSDSRSWPEKLETLGRLYKNDDNPVMQELWFLGRYHGQYHWSEGNAGEDEGYEVRRFRIGAQGRFFKKLTLHAQMVSGSDFEPFYNGFTELWTQWAFNDALLLTIGQQKHRFTHDRNVSSRYLNTLERSLLTNMFGLDYTPAVTLSGKSGKFSYYTGVFSNATGRDMGDAFTDFDSGYSLLASVTYDLGTALGTDTAFWNVGYLHSDANANATNLNRFNNGFSSALILTKGSASLVSEALVGLGNKNGDAYGINIQPGWFITDKLQLATRYQLAGSNGDKGLVAQRRYERPAGLTTGDLYQAAYAGLNYHVAGHRIKLMSGVEYANLNGADLWTASVMVRVFWGPHASGPFPTAQMLKAR